MINALGATSAVVVSHDRGASAVYAAAMQKLQKIKGLVASPSRIARIAGDPQALLKANHFLYYRLPWSQRIVWSHDFAHINRIYHFGHLTLIPRRTRWKTLN